MRFSQHKHAEKWENAVNRKQAELEALQNAVGLRDAVALNVSHSVVLLDSTVRERIWTLPGLRPVAISCMKQKACKGSRRIEKRWSRRSGREQHTNTRPKISPFISGCLIFTLEMFFPLQSSPSSFFLYQNSSFGAFCVKIFILTTGPRRAHTQWQQTERVDVGWVWKENVELMWRCEVFPQHVDKFASNQHQREENRKKYFPPTSDTE